jgi:hypothetical protein
MTDPVVIPTRPGRECPWVSVESNYWPKSAPWWQRPFRTAQHYQYALLAYKHEASLGHMPFASHLTYTQWCVAGVNSFAGDGVSEAVRQAVGHLGGFRQVLSREACLAQSDDVRRQCDAIVVYCDYDTSQSSGVTRAVKLADAHGIPVIPRYLPPHLMRQVVGESVLSTVVPVLCAAPALLGAAVATRGGFRLLRRAWRFMKRTR